MFGYYLNLALRNLRRNIVFTTLMVIAIGAGIGASMTMLTIFRAASGDPIPQKSAQLFVPQIDNFGPKWNAAVHYPGLLPPELTYLDADGLTRAHAAVRQAAMYPTSLAITPPDPGRNPIQVDARATDSDFFPMFDVPFKYGAPWTRADDVSHASVIVLTRALNDLLFGGANSVDKTLRIGDKAYRIMGVLDEWHPSPRFYDVGGHGQTFSGDDQLFVPFTRAIDEQMPTDSNLNCDRARDKGWHGLLVSNCIWLRYWVELPTTRDAENYNTFLHNYAAGQRQAGRFHWPPHVALRNVTQWLSYNQVVPPAVHTLTSVSFALLLVCILNAVGLMLADFRARSGVICVRHYTSWGSVIVTRGLARALDPGGNVLGRVALVRPSNATATIIGVVDRFGASQFADNSSIGGNSILEPLLWADSNFFTSCGPSPDSSRQPCWPRATGCTRTAVSARSCACSHLPMRAVTCIAVPGVKRCLWPSSARSCSALQLLASSA